MDHNKQIRDSLEKQNQLVFFSLFRFFQGLIPNILSALSVKNIIKITTGISFQRNTGRESISAPTIITLRTSAISTSTFGTAAKRKLMRKLKKWLSSRKKEDKEWHSSQDKKIQIH